MTAAGDVDEDIAAFKRFERDAWDAEMKALAPKIMQQAKAEPKPVIKLGVDSVNARKESRRKRDSMQCA